MTELQWQITIGSILIVLVLFFAIFVVLKTKRKSQKKAVTSIDTQKLLEALGGSTNITATSLEQKRLRVTLKNPKLVSQSLVRSLDISAFLTGKELKLLIKANPVGVKKELDQLISEGK